MTGQTHRTDALLSSASTLLDAALFAVEPPEGPVEPLVLPCSVVTARFTMAWSDRTASTSLPSTLIYHQPA